MEILKIQIQRELSTFPLRIDLETGEGIHVLFGRSGVGKTQTLECVAGLSRPDSGLISLGHRILFKAVEGEKIVNVPPRSRRIGYVFQDGALFPHKTLLENVMYPMRTSQKGPARGAATELLSEMGLQSLVGRYPSEVSGGQKRRAAIARALASKPDLLLLDEPFVHLDRVVRSKLMDDLTTLVEEHQLPAILVTHDLDVAATVSNSISVMEAGQIIQSGSREEVLFRPVTGGLARLLGDVNILKGEVAGESSGVWNVTAADASWSVPHLGSLQIGVEVEVVIRTGSVKIIKQDMEVPESLSLNVRSASVATIDRRPDFYWVRFTLDSGVTITGRVPSDTFRRTGLGEGDNCTISIAADGISLFPLDSSTSNVGQ
ncbi:MAG TPA: ATP-binding cassette domain-containing protein [Acidobacteriota bacterium]|nr:ATP-binding cassette domain-containing protein [Acidobacteriota bacterium]